MTKYLHSSDIFWRVLKCKRRKSRQRLSVCSCCHKIQTKENYLNKLLVKYNFKTLPGEPPVLQRWPEHLAPARVDRGRRWPRAAAALELPAVQTWPNVHCRLTELTATPLAKHLCAFWSVWVCFVFPHWPTDPSARTWDSDFTAQTFDCEKCGFLIKNKYNHACSGGSVGFLMHCALAIGCDFYIYLFRPL